jgi:hypothetical protein
MKPNPRVGVAHLLTLWIGLLVALCSLPALAVTVTDTFTNAANWEAFLFAGPEYNLAVTNGRLNYTATVTNEGGAAVRRIAKDLPGNTNVLYLTQDWSLKVDVHIDPLTVTAYDQFTDVFLGFAKTGDEFNTHVIFEFDRGGWEYFNDYDIGDDVQINGNAAPGLFNVSGLTSPDAALRFDYNAASHTITYLFDANGATGGYNWASMGTTNLASGTYDLQLGASDTLTIILVGSSALTVVSNGQAYLDNLEITVTAAGDAPDSISGYTVAGAITNINGTPFGPAAATNFYSVSTFSQLGPNADNTYSGNYTYVKTGPNTATIFTYKTAPPDQAGETGTNHLVFASPLTGTFAHYYDYVDTPLTVQYGTFQVVQTNVLTGLLQVTISPVGAISAGAQWQVDGGAWQNSGVSVSNLSVGIHTVSYKNISGWSTPSSQTASIIANTTTITNGVYYSTADYTYTTNNGAITITGYVGPGGAVTIPDSINGRPVTQISGDAFTHKYSLTGISCPNTVTNIGSHTFYSCTNLASLSLGAGVRNIEINAFAFCSSLSAVNFPASLTNIGYGAFQYCRGITSVALVYGVINLADYAFNNCSGLTEVNLPASVTSLGVGVFAGCSSLNAIGADSANPSFASSNGVLFTKSLKRLVQYPGGRAGAYAIPASVTGIGSLAFANCWRLTGITFPNGVTNVGASAFALCSGLTNLVIPSTIRSLEDQAFGYCNALKSVFFAGNPPSLGGSSVYINDNNATVYYLPGTTGWGATYGGRPAVLWNPTPLTSAANFGVQTNRFGFTLTGTANIPFVVEASTNLAGGSWTALLTGTLTNGAIYFSDPQWTNHRNRYYRIRSP